MKSSQWQGFKEPQWKAHIRFDGEPVPTGLTQADIDKAKAEAKAEALAEVKAAQEEQEKQNAYLAQVQGIAKKAGLNEDFVDVFADKAKDKLFGKSVEDMQKEIISMREAKDAKMTRFFVEAKKEVKASNTFLGGGGGETKPSYRDLFIPGTSIRKPK